MPIELLMVFSVVIVGFLVADLGYFNRRAHKIGLREAASQSMFWVAIAVGFGFLVLFYMGKDAATEFMSAYVTEKLLSVDNLFVILLLFNFFKLDEKYHHRVLFWGIMGAVVFRALFISAGSLIVHQFHWVLYIFGALLIITGIKLLKEKKEEHIDFKNNKIFKLAHKYLSFSPHDHGGKFISWENGKMYFTTLFMILILVETTDIVFAVDSIPAAFAISQNPFIVFTSNIFAVMGLRAMFFLIENILHSFHHLQKGLSFILIFIGAKMLADIFSIHISSLVSFSVIMMALFLSLLLSVVFPKKI